MGLLSWIPTSNIRIPYDAFRIPHSAFPGGSGPCRRGRGFTLLELLVGLTIATFIMASAAVVFVTTLDNWERGNREQRLLQAAQTSADVIERTLRCAVTPGKTYGAFTGEDLSTEEADGHRLTFCTTAQGRFPRSVGATDISEVEFCYDPNQDTVMTMRIDSTPDDDPSGGGMRVQLSPYIQAFKVTYFDGVEWTTEWYEDQLPKAVEFHLIIGDPDDLAADGTVRTREISRLVWLPMGKERPPEATGDLDEGQGGGMGDQMGGGQGSSGEGMISRYRQ